ncbi:hypothetical protein [Thalassolituus sp. UBA3500]|uniref:hypothetical protein n=1 Tax=Thalassolituus sp. UBA3500 TaxID=1947664 RepID=UPI000C0CB55C|nr:hypothetical protein [Thalassolituus sp. UBA3500]MBN57823.1 hypothetical protein [Oceanospirillaceae bacterium]|tara:strand:+ start:4967 stop:5170 length:204 start_codon:yes stop_codon:yes gene_type:complete
MLKQKHPEISITFRRLTDNSIAVQSVTRASSDNELSQIAKSYSQEIAARWEEMTAKLSEPEQPQEIH